LLFFNLQKAGGSGATAGRHTSTQALMPRRCNLAQATARRAHVRPTRGGVVRQACAWSTRCDASQWSRAQRRAQEQPQRGAGRPRPARHDDTASPRWHRRQGGGWEWGWEELGFVVVGLCGPVVGLFWWVIVA
jgi:hypothetical protein